MDETDVLYVCVRSCGSLVRQFEKVHESEQRIKLRTSALPFKILSVSVSEMETKERF